MEHAFKTWWLWMFSRLCGSFDLALQYVLCIGLEEVHLQVLTEFVERPHDAARKVEERCRIDDGPMVA